MKKQENKENYGSKSLTRRDEFKKRNSKNTVQTVKMIATSVHDSTVRRPTLFSIDVVHEDHPMKIVHDIRSFDWILAFAWYTSNLA